MVTTIAIIILCKQKKLKTLVASLPLQQVKEVGVAATQEEIRPVQIIECTCKIQKCTILILSISVLGLVLFVIIKLRKLNLFRGHLFSNIVKSMLFISDTKYHVPIK